MMMTMMMMMINYYYYCSYYYSSSKVLSPLKISRLPGGPIKSKTSVSVTTAFVSQHVLLLLLVVDVTPT